MDLQNEIVFSALLYDIGKFADRAGISQYINKLPHQEKELYIHDYSLYTHGFIDELNSEGYFTNLNFNLSNILNLVSKHDNSDNPLTYIITESDRLSSGNDRNHNEKTENDVSYKTQALRSVFDKVNFVNINNNTLYYKLNTFSYSNIQFDKSVHLNEGDYKKLWDNFVSDFKKTKSNEIQNYFKKIDTLFENYLWAVPSTINCESDISLYDQLSARSSIAVALYRYHLENGTDQNVNEIKNKEIKKFLFISGDLSGIQNYIFDLNSTKYVSKLLRARSFQLQALSDSICDYILDEFKLPIFSKIMNAGGRFILLLPNINSIKSKIDGIRTAIERFFLKEFIGKLSFNISQGVECSGNDLNQKNAISLFQSISEDVNKAKNKKFQSILNNPDDHILKNNYDLIQKNGLCVQCRVRPVHSENNFCQNCQYLQVFAGKLPKSKYINLSKSCNSNDAIPLFAEWSAHMIDTEIKNGSKDIYSINRYTSNLPNKHYPFYVPINEKNEVLTLEEIATKSEGINNIGMFKADVDNLGGIFSIGMKENISISRYSSLSRMLNYFFSEYLYYYISENKKYQYIYTVFSGGDDLCLIGPWNTIIEFALDFQKKFSEYTGFNNSITISGGIAISKSKLPVKTLTHSAEHSLEQSKGHHDYKKNCITVFDTTVSWSELENQLKISDLFSDCLKQNQNDKNQGFTKGFLYRLLKYSGQFLEIEKGNFGKSNALWKSHLYYDIARNIKDNKVKEVFFKDVVNKPEIMRKLKIAVSNSIYKLRS